MTRRLLFYALALAVMLGAATGRSAPVRAGSAPDDPPASDPVSVQAPVSVQGPAAGLPFSPPTASAGLPSVPPRQPPAPPVDTTAVIRPSTAIAPFATAQCRDAWFSYSQTVATTCAGHGGVLTWITQPGDVPGYAAEQQNKQAVEAAQSAANDATLSSWAAAGRIGTVTIGNDSMQFIPYPGNGGGPTQCANGLYSHSSGQGTCSHNGGEAG